MCWDLRGRPRFPRSSRPVTAVQPGGPSLAAVSRPTGRRSSTFYSLVGTTAVQAHALHTCTRSRAHPHSHVSTHPHTCTHTLHTEVSPAPLLRRTVAVWLQSSGPTGCERLWDRPGAQTQPLSRRDTDVCVSHADLLPGRARAWWHLPGSRLVLSLVHAGPACG